MDGNLLITGKDKYFLPSKRAHPRFTFKSIHLQWMYEPRIKRLLTSLKLNCKVRLSVHVNIVSTLLHSLRRSLAPLIYGRQSRTIQNFLDMKIQIKTCGSQTYDSFCPPFCFLKTSFIRCTMRPSMSKTCACPTVVLSGSIFTTKVTGVL